MTAAESFELVSLLFLGGVSGVLLLAFGLAYLGFTR